MKKYGLIVVLIATLAAASGAIWHFVAENQTASRPTAGQEFTASQPASPAQTTPFYAEDGSAKTLAAFAGRPVLVNFWATWCGPCKEEMPSLDRLARRMAPDLAVVALSQDVNGWSKVKPYLARVKLDALGVYVDRNGALGRRLKVEALPTTWLFDADGKPVGRFVGAVDWDLPKAEAMLRKYAFAKE